MTNFLIFIGGLLLLAVIFKLVRKPKQNAKTPQAKMAPNHLLIPAIKQLIDEGHTTTFKVKGVSMRLFLENERDKVILGPCKEVKRGDVILAEVKPQCYVLHRVIKIDGSTLTLKGDGNVYGTETCQKCDIIGIAIGFYRKNRQRPDLVTGWKWRTYSKIWLAISPLRRIILGLYRRQPFRV